MLHQLILLNHSEVNRHDKDSKKQMRGSRSQVGDIQHLNPSKRFSIKHFVTYKGFRLSFRAQYKTKLVNDNDLGYIKFDEIDFLKVHTSEESPNNSR